MIAKLIVRGEDRQSALAKLHAALEQYEIAGPVTNIEFLKRICVSPAFVNGDVETGYIEKYREELFRREQIKPEVFAQAALGVLLKEADSQKVEGIFSPQGALVGFGAGYQERTFDLVEIPADGKAPQTATPVRVRQTAPGQYSVGVNGAEYADVEAHIDAATNTITSYFPHTRLSATLVRDEDRLTLFQQGKQYRLQIAVPKWAEKALGIKDVTNSVLAPMPCKVLRVEVQEGENVKKDQPLVVIESMKMETVIRAPHDGVVKKVVHGKGDMCKAGTALVEFEEEETK